MLSIPHIVSHLKFSSRYYFQRILREGTSFRHWLEKFNKLEKIGENSRLEFQLTALRDIMRHAYANIPYWKQRFQKYEIDLENISSLEELKKLPLMTKQDVLKNFSELIALNVSKYTLSKGFTSGTTGTPAIFIRDLRSIVIENAMLWHLRQKASMNNRDKMIWMRGDIVVPANQRTPPFWLRIAGGKTMFVSSYHLTPQNKTEILRAIDRFRPDGAYAYPSSAFVLAGWCNEIGRKFPFKHLHTSSETILAEHRRRITSCLEGSWIDHYGQAERVNLFASINNDYYRDYSDYSVTELLQLDDGKCEIVGSSLHNYAMPLFRYRTGDIVEARESDGNNRPIIKGLSGRKEDFITLPDGTLLGRLDLIFKGLKNIREGQIYQPSVDLVEIRAVISSRYSDEDEKNLIRNARKRLGEEILIKVNYLDAIPRTKNGKLKFVISDVKDKQSFLQ